MFYNILIVSVAIKKAFYSISIEALLLRHENNSSLETRESCHISGTTTIVKFPPKKLVAHTKMMMELTVYLAKKILHVIPANLCFVSTFKTNVRGHLGSEQEETCTKMLLHALDATNSGATSIHMCSLNAGVFVLVPRRYHNLCRNKSFETATLINSTE